MLTVPVLRTARGSGDAAVGNRIQVIGGEQRVCPIVGGSYHRDSCGADEYGRGDTAQETSHQ